MTRVTRFFAISLLVVSLSGAAFAGETQGPGNPEPPPPGETQGPGNPAPGETQGPGMPSTTDPVAVTNTSSLYAAFEDIVFGWFVSIF